MLIEMQLVAGGCPALSVGPDSRLYVHTHSLS